MDTTAVTTRTVEVPGAELYYEIRGRGPLIALHAAPMDAASFGPLADLLAVDHTVLTTDPRGINNSRVDDRSAVVTPDTRADDLARVLDHVNLGPAALFGSSGGAVSALALMQTRPELVHTVVAHEPPLADLLPDRDDLRQATADMVQTYLSGDRRGYWKQFLHTANIHMPDEVFEMVFGEQIEGKAADDERFGVENMHFATTFWQPDFSLLRSADVTCIVGIGSESAEELCDRTSRRLASELGLEPTMFPGGHIGFADDTESFAKRFREVLSN